MTRPGAILVLMLAACAPGDAGRDVGASGSGKSDPEQCGGADLRSAPDGAEAPGLVGGDRRPLREPIFPLDANQSAGDDASVKPLSEVRADEVFGFLNDITGVSRQAREDGMLDYGRIAGSVYDERTADYVRRKFTDFHMDEVWQDVFPAATASVPAEIELTLIGGSSRAAPEKDRLFATAFTTFARDTPRGGIEAEVIDVGRGSEKELAGKDITGRIVLLHADTPGMIYSHPAQQIAPRMAKQGKALGFVIAIHQPGNPDIRYAVTAGSGMWLTSWVNIAGGEGDWLAGVIRDSGPASPPRMRMRLRSEVKRDGKTRNTFGLLKGTTDEYVLVIAHTDSYFQGATDNASGVAVMLEMAKHFGRAPKCERRRNLLFVADGGHHSGPAVGTKHLVANHADTLKTTVLLLNCEHVASKGPVPGSESSLKPGDVTAHNVYVTNGSSLLKRLLREDAVRRGIPVGRDLTRYEADLFPFEPTGIPAVMLHQPTFWYHTEADTPDKVDAESLRGVTLTYIDFLAALDKRDAHEWR